MDQVRGTLLLVIPRLGLGGTEKQIALLAGGLRRCGHDARVLVLFSGGPRELDLQQEGVPYSVLGMPERPRDLWRTPAVLLRLVRLLRHLRPAVVHCFLFEAYVLVPPLARLAGVPVVASGRRALSDYKGDRRWAYWLERRANRFADVFIANATLVAEDVVSVERVPADRVVVIPNAAAPAAFEPPAAMDLGTGEVPVVVCVANLFAYKGHRVLLQALSSLADDGLHCRLVLVGDGPERAALEQEVRHRGLDVLFTGQRPDAARYLVAADLVVLPSLHEGMSNAVMEAMALARPVVATHVGGTPELLGDTGVLCPPGDPDALAEALRRVLLDDELCRRLGQAARDRLRSQFSVDRMVERHLATYACSALGRRAN